MNTDPGPSTLRFPDARATATRPQSLRLALLWLLLASLLPLAVVATAFLWMQWDLHRTEALEGLQQQAQTLALAVERELGVNLAALETLATLPHIDEQDRAQFHAISAAAMGPRALGWIVLVDASGQELINTQVTFGTPLPNLLQLRSAQQAVEWQGRPLPSFDPRILEPLRSARATVTNLFWGPVVERPVLSAAVPVMRDGKPRYSLNMGFTPDTLASLLAREHSADSILTAVIDGNGRIIAHRTQMERFAGLGAPPPFDRPATLPRAGIGEAATLEHVPVAYAYQRLSIADWIVVAAIPQQEILAPVYRTFVPWLVATLLLIAVGLFLAQRLQRRLTVPLRALANSAEALQRGQEVFIPSTRIREIDTLSHALQQAAQSERANREELGRRLASEERANAAARQLADNLRKSEARVREFNAELEQRVQERTAKLEEKSRQLENAAAALRVNEARQEALLENTPTLIGMKDLEGRYVLVNRALERSMGLPREEILGKTAAELLLPEATARIEADDRQVLAAGSLLELEETIRLPGSGKRTFLSLKFPVRDRDGRIFALCFIGTDITERKRAERELQQALAFRHAILDSATYGIVSIDTAGTILTFNPAAERMLGYTADEVVGKAKPALFHDAAEMTQRAVELSRELGEPVDASLEVLIVKARRHELGEQEWTYVRKDGTHFPVQLAITALHDARGEITGYLGVSSDITERKEAQAAIDRLNHALARRAAELEAANRELESFSYSVSHDLRAPLRSINGFSQVLVEDYADKLGDDGREWLERVCAASRHMGQLIDDILKLSRLSRAEMRREAVDLSALARGVADELRTAEPGRDNVAFAIQEGVIASGDAHLLQVVLENLIGNAWKYTSRHPGARIEFGSERGEDGSTVYFVRDDGAGFDMEYADKLFGAFQRLHSDTEFPGTGIGLTTVQRIVHRHGGRVWAEGIVEGGATFRFTLPQEAGVE